MTTGDMMTKLSWLELGRCDCVEK